MESQQNSIHADFCVKEKKRIEENENWARKCKRKNDNKNEKKKYNYSKFF